MRSLPLIIGISSAWVPPMLCLGFLLATSHDISRAFTILGLLCVFAGMLYTHSFIYGYHRFPMHNYYSIPLTAHIKDSHIKHHKAFTRSRLCIPPEKLLDTFEELNGRRVLMNDMISQRWWVPGSIVAFHLGGLLIVVDATYVMMFGFGLVIHYTMYDVSHWFTHVRPTRLGTFLERLPFIGKLWIMTVHIHDVHHTTPDVDFNFTWPWLGDKLFGTFAENVVRRNKQS